MAFRNQRSAEALFRSHHHATPYYEFPTSSGTLTVATAYDYNRLIKALLLPESVAQMRLDALDDGDISRFLGELMKRKGSPVDLSDRAGST